MFSMKGGRMLILMIWLHRLLLTKVKSMKGGLVLILMICLHMSPVTLAKSMVNQQDILNKTLLISERQF